MTDQQIQVPGDVAIKVAIGEVCLQWARLEMALIGLICQIEPMETETDILFGGLDIQPRVNMAISLAQHRKLPVAFTRRITAVRAKLQNGLNNRRNMVVHGAHRDMEGAETTLTMIRWKGDKRHTRLNAVDISKLAHEIHELGSEVWAISNDLLLRSFRQHVKENLGDALGKR